MPISVGSEADRSPAMLTVTGLTAGYGGAAVISEIGLRVGSGEVVAVVGPNGAGKSTLLKALIGEVEVIAGAVRLGTEDVAGFRADRLARLAVGYVPQTTDVFETLTVQDNLEVGAYLLPRRDVRLRVEEVVSQFPILANLRDRRAAQLSGGERKLLGIGRALMVRPRLLLLDEPSAKLSPKLAKQILREEVKHLAELRVGVLLVEQKVSDALAVADWAYVLVDGRVQISGQAQDVLHTDDLREVFLGRRPAAAAR